MTMIFVEMKLEMPYCTLKSAGFLAPAFAVKLIGSLPSRPRLPGLRVKFSSALSGFFYSFIFSFFAGLQGLKPNNAPRKCEGYIKQPERFYAFIFISVTKRIH